MTADGSVVMIVDDDDSMRRAARRLVKSFGLGVDTFASAEDFLASGRLAETACLVLDVHMPGLSGIELQSKLIAEGHHIPVIFITAFADEKTQARALEAGAYAYLIKPFDEDDLLEGIRRALQPRNTTPQEEPPS
jgi:FixJ family two-component response regulator